MPAIITDRFKKEILLNLQKDIDSAANNYYVSVGRPIDWNGTDTAQHLLMLLEQFVMLKII